MRLRLLALVVLVACGPSAPKKTYVIVNVPEAEPDASTSTESEDEGHWPCGPGPKECGACGWADCVVGKRNGHSASALKSFRALFDRQCQELDVGGCIKLGVMQANGDGGPQDMKAAAGSFERACELEPNVCVYLEAALNVGDGVPVDQRLAKILASKRPRETAQRPDESLRERRDESLYGDKLTEWERSDRDVVRAYEFDCRKGKAEACAKAAVMYEAASEIDRDADRAYELFFTACDLDRSQCMDISQAYGEGEKVKRNKEYAKRFRRMALSPENRDDKTPSCRYGDSDRCVTFAHAYMTGEQVGKDLKYAAVLFDEACATGDARGCEGLGEMYWSGKGTYKDRHKSLDLFEKACTKRLGAACWKLGRLYMRGEVIDQDLDRAKELFKRACDLGDQAGCNYIERAP